MLTYSTNYKYETLDNATHDIWFAKLFYGSAGSSDYVGISAEDIIISGVQYYGVVSSWGEITETINLEKSTASTSDVTINCINDFKGGSFSDVLFGGSEKYINRKVEIYSYRNGYTLQLYTGRLINVQFDQNNLTINIEGVRPWDKIKIPQTQSTLTNEYAPVVYGSYSAGSASTYYNKKELYPVPFENRLLNNLYFRTHQGDTTLIHLYYYDRGLDKFIPFTSTAQSTLGTDGVYHVSVPVDLERTVRISAQSNTSGDFTNPEYAYDKNSDHSGNTTTGATNSDSITNASTGGESISNYLTLSDVEEPSGKITALTAYVNAKVEVTSSSGGDFDVGLYSRAYSAWNQLVLITSGSTSGTFSVSELSGYQASGLITDSWDIIAQYYAGETCDIAGTVTIYDTYFEATLALDFANEASSSESFLQSVTEVYSYHDGYSKSYSGGSGLAELPHEIYRDLLARFTDFDYSDSAWEYWSNLNSARSGWTCRWWLHDLTDLEEILNKLTYEGCFIPKVKNTADGVNLIWVHDSYSSADFVLSKPDYANMELSLTDISEIKTSITYNYKRHPAKPSYLETTTYTNSTARIDWNAGTNEDKTVVNLDFLVADKVNTGSNPNDSLARYYDNIVSNPKIIVKCEIVNESKFSIEAGDIVRFNNADITPFGKSWGDLYFMVIETHRQPGLIEITAREVYEA